MHCILHVPIFILILFRCTGTPYEKRIGLPSQMIGSYTQTCCFGQKSISGCAWKKRVSVVILPLFIFPWYIHCTLRSFLNLTCMSECNYSWCVFIACNCLTAFWTHVKLMNTCSMIKYGLLLVLNLQVIWYCL